MIILLNHPPLLFSDILLAGAALALSCLLILLAVAVGLMGAEVIRAVAMHWLLGGADGGRE